MLPRVTCAAPAYLERRGTPETIEDLAHHLAVGLRSITTGVVTPFEFVTTAGLMRVEMAAPFSVTGTETFLDGVRRGLGLAQMPVFHIERDLAAGRLVQVLPHHPLPAGPVSVLYPRSRQLSPRVRLFIDWIVQRFSMSGGNGSAG
jgi:DNA-binding transcriptional LysR family regulator